MKVHIISGNHQYSSMFVREGFKLTSVPLEADLLCFTGGEDVTPSLYGEKKHPTTFNDPDRDRREEIIFHEAVEESIPMVGICRGGQFLNVMNGGRMFQHVSAHGGMHSMKDLETDEIINVSSTHHQMMRTGPACKIIATANLGGTKEFMPLLDGKLSEPIRLDTHIPDIEVVYYPHTLSLCFQPHPEFTGPQYEPMTKYFFKLINRFFSNTR